MKILIFLSLLALALPSVSAQSTATATAQVTRAAAKTPATKVKRVKKTGKKATLETAGKMTGKKYAVTSLSVNYGVAPSSVPVSGKKQ